MATQSLLRFRPGLGISDLATTVAEEDKNLANYYVGRDLYVERAINRDDHASVFIGPKGVGKSAILQMVRSHAMSTGNATRLIDIAPDDLAFNSLINIDSQTPLLKASSQNQWLFTSLWDYVICAELIQRESASGNSIVGVFRSLFGDKSRKQQDDLLRVTLDDSGRQKSMSEKMLALINAIELEGGYAGGTVKANVKLADRQGQGSDLQLLQLVSNVAKQLPKSLKHEYYILVDDLDLHWTGTDLQNAFIAAMFLSIRKLSRQGGIKFVVSLRKPIYRTINLEERDKFAPYVCDVEWGKAAVLEMIAARLQFVLQANKQQIADQLFPSGSFEYLWAHTDGMPRELLRVVCHCVDQAVKDGESTITAGSINKAVYRFSCERLDELGSLVQYQHPHIQLVLKQFTGKAREFSVDHLQEIAMRVLDLVNMNKQLAHLEWATAGFEDPLVIGRALLSCGFLLLKDGRSAVPRVPSSDDIHLVDASKWFSVHPMYHAALGVNGFKGFNG